MTRLSLPAEPEESPDFSAMTKAQLLEYAEAQGISGLSSRNTKAEIIARLEAV